MEERKECAVDKDKRKELRARYDERRPVMGIVCWRSGDRMWMATSKDADADRNGSLFQLELGSFRNREMQEAFNADPASFQWSVLRELDYEDREEDHGEELELLYLLCQDEFPDAKQMRPGRK